MWRLWDTDTQEEHWHSYNEASDEIPVLASDSDKSVIFVVERPSPYVQGQGIIVRVTIKTLPIFSRSGSDASLSLGKSLLINIFYL